MVYSPRPGRCSKYRMTCISPEATVLKMHPRSTGFTFRTARQVPGLAVVLVGWGANKGSRLLQCWPTDCACPGPRAPARRRPTTKAR